MSWLAKKLGVAEPGQAPAPQYVPPQTPQAYAQQQVMQPQPQVGQQAVSGQQKLNNVSFSDALALAEQGVLVTQGDPKGAARYDKELCPDCGGMLFSRQTASSSHGAGGRVMKPDGQMVMCAPICTDCGYRGGYYPRQTGELYDAPPDTPEG